MNANLAAVHFRAEPIAGVAENFDPPAAHLRPQMPAGVSFDANRPFGHLGANAVNARQIAGKMDFAVGRIAGNGE